MQLHQAHNGGRGVGGWGGGGGTLDRCTGVHCGERGQFGLLEPVQILAFSHLTGLDLLSQHK